MVRAQFVLEDIVDLMSEHSFIFSMPCCWLHSLLQVYVWSKRNPHVHMSFLGLFTFTAPYLPWVSPLFVAWLLRKCSQWLFSVNLLILSFFLLTGIARLFHHCWEQSLGGSPGILSRHKNTFDQLIMPVNSLHNIKLLTHWSYNLVFRVCLQDTPITSLRMCILSWLVVGCWKHLLLWKFFSLKIWLWSRGLLMDFLPPPQDKRFKELFDSFFLCFLSRFFGMIC